jgi:uncharacterized membrane protein YesL
VKRRPNDGLFDFLDKAVSFIMANLLWVLLSIPLVTLPAATAGLFATMSLWARGEPTEVFQDFFSGVRQHWRKASIIVVLDLLLGGLVILNFFLFRLMNIPPPITLLFQSVTLFVAVTLIMVNLYLWPLMVTFGDFSLRRLVDTSLRLVFIHPLWSLVMLVLALLPFALSMLLPVAVLVLASFSTFALIVSWAALRVIRRYLPEPKVSQ